MKTRLSTITELKQVFTETLLNNTNRVSKIADNSVLSGIAFGVAKVSQKAIKDIALVESHILVDSAYGSQLDSIADSKGIAPRFGSSGSSSFVRVVGLPGTVYQNGVHTLTGVHGQVFDIEQDLTLGVHGFGYVKVRSQGVGRQQNVDSLTLTKISPEPAGHEFCINEYAAFGGRDIEDDDLFKKRIKEGANLAATSTLSKITQIFNKLNNNVIRVFYHGKNSQGQIVLAVVTHNGIDLSPSELNDIEIRSEDFLAISDLKPFGSTISNLEVKNIEYQPIDISFRVEVESSYNIDEVRKDIQVQISKYLDFRFWEPDMKVEWDDLLNIVKNTEGVRSVPDTQFIPGTDITVDSNKLPRIRSFLMLDLNGNILANVAGTLNPLYYPANPDSSYQQTILSTI